MGKKIAKAYPIRFLTPKVYLPPATRLGGPRPSSPVDRRSTSLTSAFGGAKCLLSLRCSMLFFCLIIYFFPKHFVSIEFFYVCFHVFICLFLWFSCFCFGCSIIFHFFFCRVLQCYGCLILKHNVFFGSFEFSTTKASAKSAARFALRFGFTKYTKKDRQRKPRGSMQGPVAGGKWNLISCCFFVTKTGGGWVW